MCGFLFVLNKSKNMEPKEINKISELLKHRGPDDKHTFNNNEISAVFYRLSIRDTSKRGRQPFFSRSKRYLMCFNGEIYNSENLKKKLKNQFFRGNSDTEVLVQLFDKFGLKAIDYIEGMFSIVLYDLTKKICYGIRDRLGIKPLYYTEDKNYFIFSSEIKPLLSYLKMNNQLDRNTIKDFLFKGYLSHGQETFFKNIKSVEAGHIITFSNLLKLKKYYDITNFKETEIDEYKLDKLISKTISRHLISDRNIGLFLSGGTDSTALAIYAKNCLKKSFNTFTYDFVNYDGGESIKSEKISKDLNLQFNKVYITPNNVIDNFDKLIKKIESPITSIRLFGIDALYELAKKKNISVILEGHGGDEMMGGYDYNYYPYLMDHYKNKKKKVEKYLLKSLSKAKIKNLELSFNYQGLSTTDGTPFFDKKFFNRDFSFNKKDLMFVNYPNLNNLKNSQIEDIKYIKLPRMLQYTDRISMSHGIEARVPFLDTKLFQICFNLKNKYKYRKNTSRWILKKLFDKKLNKNNKYFTRYKKTIVDPQRDWFKTNLKDFVFDNLNSLDFKNMGYFDQKYILKYFDNYLKSENASSFNLIQVLSFYRFYKIFIKKYV